MARTAKPTSTGADETPQIKFLDKATFLGLAERVIAKTGIKDSAGAELANEYQRCDPLGINKKAMKDALKLRKLFNTDQSAYRAYMGALDQYLDWLDVRVQPTLEDHAAVDQVELDAARAAGRRAAELKLARTSDYRNPAVAAQFEGGYDERAAEMEISPEALAEARERGAAAARDGEERKAPFSDPGLVSEFEAGFDDARGDMKETHAALDDVREGDGESGGDISMEVIGKVQQEAVRAFGADAPKDACPYKAELQPIHRDVWIAKWNELSNAKKVGAAGATNGGKAKGKPFRKRGEAGDPAPVH